MVQNAVQTLPFGGRDISSYLLKQLGLKPDRGTVGSLREHRLVTALKEELCFVGAPAAISETTSGRSFALPDGKTLQLDVHDAHLSLSAGGKEEPVRLNRRIAENFFFSPLALEPIGGEFAIDCEEGLHQRLWACVNACSMDTRTKLLSNVVLAGGNTLTAGLPELLYKKVKALGKLFHVPFRQAHRMNASEPSRLCRQVASRQAPSRRNRGAADNGTHA